MSDDMFDINKYQELLRLKDYEQKIQDYTYKQSLNAEDERYKRYFFDELTKELKAKKAIPPAPAYQHDRTPINQHDQKAYFRKGEAIATGVYDRLGALYEVE